MLSGFRAHIIDAVVKFCDEHGLEPYIWVEIDEACLVNLNYVHNGGIVLDLSSDAVSDLSIKDDWISFRCDFNEELNSLVCIPVGRVIRVAPSSAPGEGAHFYSEPSGEQIRATCPYPQEVYGETGVVRQFRPRRNRNTD